MCSSAPSLAAPASTSSLRHQQPLEPRLSRRKAKGAGLDLASAGIQSGPAGAGEKANWSAQAFPGPAHLPGVMRTATNTTRHLLSGSTTSGATGDWIELTRRRRYCSTAARARPSTRAAYASAPTDLPLCGTTRRGGGGSIIIGQQWKQDERVVLFVQAQRQVASWTTGCVKRICQQIKAALHRHVMYLPHPAGGCHPRTSPRKDSGAGGCGKWCTTARQQHATRQSADRGLEPDICNQPELARLIPRSISIGGAARHTHFLLLKGGLLDNC